MSRDEDAMPRDEKVRPERTSTRALLVGGVVAGPVFFVVAGVQAALRDGFDLSRHPISALSLAGAGWVQIVNFVLTGVLVLVAAVGLRRVLRPDRGGTWGPRLVAVFGGGYVAAGVFPTDPADGFPPGAPEGSPDSFSWHAVLHGTASTLALVAILVACVVLATTLGARYASRWRLISRLVPVGVVVVMVWPQGCVSLRLAIASLLTFGWLAAVSARAAFGLARTELGPGPRSDRPVAPTEGQQVVGP